MNCFLTVIINQMVKKKKKLFARKYTRSDESRIKKPPPKFLRYKSFWQITFGTVLWISRFNEFTRCGSKKKNTRFVIDLILVHEYTSLKILRQTVIHSIQKYTFVCMRFTCSKYWNSQSHAWSETFHTQYANLHVNGKNPRLDSPEIVMSDNANVFKSIALSRYRRSSRGDFCVISSRRSAKLKYCFSIARWIPRPNRVLLAFGIKDEVRWVEVTVWIWFGSGEFKIFKMNNLLCATVLIAVVSTLVSANPVFEKSSLINDDDAWLEHASGTYLPATAAPLKHSRSERSAQNDSDKFKLSGGGGHSRQSGTDIYLQGQARVWQSPNKLNEVHVNGNYGQHFGGPYGRSPPSLGGGLTFVRRF